MALTLYPLQEPRSTRKILFPFITYWLLNWSINFKTTKIVSSLRFVTVYTEYYELKSTFFKVQTLKFLLQSFNLLHMKSSTDIYWTIHF